jgi:predicted nucleic acid-binding protein
MEVGIPLCAPHLIDAEFAHVLRRLVLLKQVSVKRAEEALSDYIALYLVRFEHVRLMGRVWQLRSNLSAYDALYIALAEMLEAPLITCDHKITARGLHRAKTVLLKPVHPPKQ